METVVKFFVFGLAIFSACASVLTSAETLNGRLEFDNGGFLVLWEVDEGRTQLTLDLTVLCQGWFGIGFSATGNMVGADMAVTEVIVNDQGIEVLETKDYYSVTANNVPKLDAVQNLGDIRTGRNDTHSYAHFTRPLDTGDSQDMVLTLDGIYIIWAFSDNAEEMEYHRNNRGGELVVFEAK